MFRYYSAQRPVAPGTFPKDGCISVHNYDERQHVEAIGREAWGYIEYDRQLTGKEVESYELIPHGVKTWYAVMITRWNEGSCMKGEVQARIMDSRVQTEQPEGREATMKTRKVAVVWYDGLETAEAAVKAAVA